MKEILAERDKYRKNTQDLADAKFKLVKQLETTVENNKRRVNEIEKHVKQTKEELNLVYEECQTLEKEKRGMVLEKEKMKERIKKLK